jgi:hypothetical protein
VVQVALLKYYGDQRYKRLLHRRLIVASYCCRMSDLFSRWQNFPVFLIVKQAVTRQSIYQTLLVFEIVHGVNRPTQVKR